MPLPPDFEKRLWDAADQLWTNSTLKPHEYSMPVLALIFLRYVDQRFAQAEAFTGFGAVLGYCELSP